METDGVGGGVVVPVAGSAKLNVGGGGVEGAGETGGVEGVNGPCGGILVPLFIWNGNGWCWWRCCSSGCWFS